MSPEGRKFCLVVITAAIVALPIIAGFAVAAVLSGFRANGLTTIPAATAPRKECGKRYMDFPGERRFDTGGGVPDYRNLSVTRDGDEYRLIDEFNTGQIRARLDYNIRRSTTTTSS